MNEEEFYRIVTPEVQRIISEYKGCDPVKLALKLTGHDEWPTRAIVEQVSCCRKAAHKIPKWLERGVLLDETALQQASGETTAQYKAGLIDCKGRTAIDITGGLGVDAAALSGNFDRFYYVDLNPVMCLMARYNFDRLGLSNISITNGDALQILNDFPDGYFDLIYADPSRRSLGRRTINLQNSKPDISVNLGLLKSKTKNILLKLSPMMDITDAVRLLEDISFIDVLSFENECKEVLVMMNTVSKGSTDSVTIKATRLNSRGEIDYQLKGSVCEDLTSGTRPVGDYLCLPDPAIVKAGLVDRLCLDMKLFRIHSSVTYLTTDKFIRSFPGKIYRTVGVMPVNNKKVSSYLKAHQITKANIATRGFPGTSDLLYKRLKIKHGGDDFLFFTRDANDQYIMIHSVAAEAAAVGSR